MESTTREEFFERMQAEFPDKLICHFSSVKSYADWQYREDPTPYTPPDMICHCNNQDQLTGWVPNELRSDREGRRKSLILFGPTRFGKSLWARSLGKHAYFPGLFMLDDLDESCTYAIFDDIAEGFKGVPCIKYWFGGQKEFVLTDKYRSKRRVKWGKPSIYLSNDNPLDSVSPEDREWLQRNCTIVDATSYVAHANEGEGSPIIKDYMECEICTSNRNTS